MVTVMVIVHKPVLLNEVLAALNPQPGEFFIDGTLGGGGHAEKIIERLGEAGSFLGIDRDARAVQNFQLRAKDKKIKISAIQGNYVDLPEILEREKLGKADGLLFDLGMSSDQLESSGRGFSFSPEHENEPLLMTYDENSKSAKDVLRELSEAELAEMIKNLSGERFSNRIARAIKEQEKKNPISSVRELVSIIKTAVPKNYERGRINPATRTFMALRIYVNRELENLETALKSLRSILKSGGRVAIISFHSLEDRLVKNYFRNYAKVGQFKVLTKKPIIASKEELIINPRARSAKLRAALLL